MFDMVADLTVCLNYFQEIFTVCCDLRRFQSGTMDFYIGYHAYCLCAYFPSCKEASIGYTNIHSETDP